MLSGDLLSAIGTGLSLPFFIVYLHRVRGIDLAVAGLIVAAGPFASLAGNPISGVLVDRIGARRTVLVGLVVAAAGAASIAFVTEPWQGFAAAGTTGNVGPNLDKLKPDEARVKRQVENGGAIMPAFKGRLTPAQIAAVAKFVASVAGCGDATTFVHLFGCCAWSGGSCLVHRSSN